MHVSKRGVSGETALDFWYPPMLPAPVFFGALFTMANLAKRLQVFKVIRATACQRHDVIAFRLMRRNDTAARPANITITCKHIITAAHPRPPAHPIVTGFNRRLCLNSTDRLPNQPRRQPFQSTTHNPPTQKAAWTIFRRLLKLTHTLDLSALNLVWHNLNIFIWFKQALLTIFFNKEKRPSETRRPHLIQITTLPTMAT